MLVSKYDPTTQTEVKMTVEKAIDLYTKYVAQFKAVKTHSELFEMKSFNTWLEEGE